VELLIAIGAIIAILTVFFSFGAAVKILWGWIPLAIGIAVCLLIGQSGGFWQSVFAIAVFLLSLIVTDAWHRTSIYIEIEEKIDKLFYFDD